MRRARTLLVLGIWVAVLPYLGFPSSWKEIFFTLSGMGIIYTSFILYREYKKNEKKDRAFENFSEGGPDIVMGNM